MTVRVDGRQRDKSEYSGGRRSRVQSGTARGHKCQGRLPRCCAPHDDSTGWPGGGEGCGETLARAFSLGRPALRSGRQTAGHPSETPGVMPGPKMRVFPGRSLFSLQAVLPLEKPSRAYAGLPVTQLPCPRPAPWCKACSRTTRV